MVQISPPPESRTHIVTEARQITVFLGPPPSTAAGEVHGPRTAPAGHEAIQAYLADYRLPYFVLPPHFHPVDQFQVVVSGGGRIGKHPLHPGSLHYADADTPYGPIVAGPDGIAFFTLRVCPSNATHTMPQSRSLLTRRAGRARYADADTSTALGLDALSVAQVTDLLREDDGVAARLVRVPAFGAVEGLDPSSGLGQYYVVTAGGVLYDGVELPRFSCLHVAPTEPQPRMSATLAGAEVIILQFGTARSTQRSP